MSRINRVPLGLQSVLGTKALGQNPDDLAQQVVPIIDLSPYYLSEMGLRQASTAEPLVTPAILTAFAEVEIPAGESWWVYNVSIQVTASASLLFDTGIGYTLPTTGTNIANWLGDYPTSAVGIPTINPARAYVRGRNFGPPVLFGPGTVFACWPTAIQTAGTNQATFRTLVAYVEATV